MGSNGLGAEIQLGACQNYGPCWIPTIVRRLMFRVPKKGSIFLTTTHDTVKLTGAMAGVAAWIPTIILACFPKMVATVILVFSK